MAGYKTKQFRKSLAKKGFIKEEKTRHTYYHFFWKGKMTEICTFVSRGEKEFDEALFNERKKQIEIQEKKDMLDFYNCPMSKKDYSSYLTVRGIIEPDED